MKYAREASISVTEPDDKGMETQKVYNCPSQVCGPGSRRPLSAVSSRD